MKKQSKIYKKRRREGKTDYRKRIVLLKGNLSRLVVRKSNRYLMIQIVGSDTALDKVIVAVNTKELLGLGWPAEKSGSLKSLGASYLGGYLIGNKMKGKVDGKVILDSGLTPNTKGSRIYAVVKGISDAGIDIKYDEKDIHSKERIEKEDFFNKVKDGIK